jgi:hypothetical protein
MSVGATMTEAEWLACEEFEPMLTFLRDKASPRKWRLFACAWSRSWCHLLVNQSSHHALFVSEQYADGGTTKEQLKQARRSASGTARGDVRRWGPEKWAARAAVSAASLDIATYLPNIAYTLNQIVPLQGQSGPGNRPGPLLRCVFNPFRAVKLNSTWLTSAVTGLAAAAYEERALPSGELDTTRLAVLADALEDAGCADEAILSHLRGSGPHVRGCWALDLVLGKE